MKNLSNEELLVEYSYKIMGVPYKAFPNSDYQKMYKEILRRMSQKNYKYLVTGFKTSSKGRTFIDKVVKLKVKSKK